MTQPRTLHDQHDQLVADCRLCAVVDSAFGLASDAWALGRYDLATRFADTATQLHHTHPEHRDDPTLHQ